MDRNALISTFALVFIAELGDKTQLAVLTQTCKYRSPWAVFLGGSVALTTVTALGAGGGNLIGQLVPPTVIRFLAALVFIVMGALLWRETTTMPKETNELKHCPPDNSECLGWNWQAFGSTFALLFIAELGDKTQLTVMGLSCRHSTPWAVFIGGSAALIAITALGVIGGQQLNRLLPERLLLRIAAAAFIAMGILMGLGVV